MCGDFHNKSRRHSLWITKHLFLRMDQFLCYHLCVKWLDEGKESNMLSRFDAHVTDDARVVCSCILLYSPIWKCGGWYRLVLNGRIESCNGSGYPGWAFFHDCFVLCYIILLQIMLLLLWSSSSCPWMVGISVGDNPHNIVVSWIGVNDAIWELWCDSRWE